MLGAGMHDEAFDLQRVAVLLAPRTGRSQAFPLAQAVVGSTIVADGPIEDVEASELDYCFAPLEH